MPSTPNPVNVRVGEHLRQLMEERGMSRRKLGMLTSIHRQTIIKILAGRQPLDPDKAALFAKALDIEYRDVYPKDVPSLPPPPPSPNGQRDQTPSDIDPRVLVSLESYLSRKGNLIGGYVAAKLWEFARGVNPSDPHIPMTDELWDHYVDLVRRLYRNTQAS